MSLPLPGASRQARRGSRYDRDIHVKRVVSLACSNTEIICALGASDLLVGVDDHSDYPVEVVSRLTRVGPDLSVDIEKIRALKPDLVVASLTVPGHERNVQALEAAGLPFVAPEPISLEDVHADIRLIGAALGRRTEAEALSTRLRREIAEPAAATAARRPKILVEWWPKPVIAPGARSWVTDLLSSAGALNPIAERDVKSTPLTDEEVARLDPDAIVISWCGVRPEKYRPHVVYRRPALQGLRALERRRVYCVPEAYLGRPGPRLVEGYRAFRAIVDEVLADLP
jgi:iron complex transport system substrate-binding protein